MPDCIVTGRFGPKSLLTAREITDDGVGPTIFFLNPPRNPQCIRALLWRKGEKSLSLAAAAKYGTIGAARSES